MCYKMAKKSYISDTFTACYIFVLPHYFWNDPYSGLIARLTTTEKGSKTTMPNFPYPTVH